MADIKALVDSGATDNFIHPTFAQQMGLGTRSLERPRKIWNVDNSENKAGCITHYVTLNVQTKGRCVDMNFLVMDIGNEEVLLGYPWLATYEPHISWRLAAPTGDVLPIIIRSQANQTLPDPSQPVLESHVHTTATELVVAARKPDMEVMLPPEYAKFTSLFNEEASHHLPSSRPWDHAINFVKDAPKFLNCKIYPMTREEDQALKTFLDEQLKKGYIRPSISPYASPFFFIKKKNGKLRPIQDYRKINSITVQNMAPVPRASEHIHDLGGALFYTKINVRSGYNNVCIKEGDEEKAMFKTRYGLFEPRVMFFGLTNSPATFQTMMNFIYRDVTLKHEALGTTIQVYIDDIGIATRTTLADHIAAVWDVLHIAQTHNLFFSLDKCLFHALEMDYLGVILGRGVTHMDPVKISGIKDWPTPTKVKDVRSFLGFCNFY